MAIEEKEKLIGDVNYKMVTLSFSAGRPALQRIVRIMGPVYASMLEHKEKPETVVLTEVPKNLSDEDVEYFANLFGKASWFEKDGAWVPLVKANQDVHFTGRYLEFFQWLMFGIEVNFAGFFSGMKGGAANLEVVPNLKEAAGA